MEGMGGKIDGEHLSRLFFSRMRTHTLQGNI